MELSEIQFSPISIIKQKSRKQKRLWMRHIYLERQQKGEFHLLVRGMMLIDHEYFLSVSH